MTDAAIARQPYPVDELAVEFCVDGYIPFAKLTAPERAAVAARLAARGYTPTEIARRTHGTLSAVAVALAAAARHATPDPGPR